MKNIIKKNVRKSNIELLRIISMILIISFHYVYKSGYACDILNFNSFIVKVFYLFGELGVNLFFLITGYFMVDGKFSKQKMVKLLLEIEFYNLITIFIAAKLNIYTFTKTKQYFLIFFPVILNRFCYYSAINNRKKQYLLFFHAKTRQIMLRL